MGRIPLRRASANLNISYLPPQFECTIATYALDHHLFLVAHSLHVGSSSHAAHRRGHVWETHGVDLGGGGEVECVGFDVGFAMFRGQSCRQSDSGAVRM